jgi:hypothetical protein
VNRYEQWLRAQPVVAKGVTLTDMLVAHYRHSVAFLVPNPTERPVSRSAARQERDREQNICSHRAFLGYGQGRSRRQ